MDLALAWVDESGELIASAPRIRYDELLQLRSMIAKGLEWIRIARIRGAAARRQQVPLQPLGRFFVVGGLGVKSAISSTPRVGAPIAHYSTVFVDGTSVRQDAVDWSFPAHAGLDLVFFVDADGVGALELRGLAEKEPRAHGSFRGFSRNTRKLILREDATTRLLDCVEKAVASSVEANKAAYGEAVEKSRRKVSEDGLFR